MDAQKVREMIQASNMVAWEGGTPPESLRCVEAVRDCNMVLKNIALQLIDPSAPDFNTDAAYQLVVRMGMPHFRLATLQFLFRNHRHEDVVAQFGEPLADFLATELIVDSSIVKDLESRDKDVLWYYIQWYPIFQAWGD